MKEKEYNTIKKEQLPYLFRGTYIDLHIFVEAEIHNFLLGFLTREQHIAEPHIIISEQLIGKLSSDEKIDLPKKCIMMKVQPETKK